jgi:hypothetical protein
MRVVDDHGVDDTPCQVRFVVRPESQHLAVDAGAVPRPTLHPVAILGLILVWHPRPHSIHSP